MRFSVPNRSSGAVLSPAIVFQKQLFLGKLELAPSAVTTATMHRLTLRSNRVSKESIPFYPQPPKTHMEA